LLQEIPTLRSHDKSAGANIFLSISCSSEPVGEAVLFCEAEDTKTALVDAGAES
jgi:hypothetical protein